MTATCPGFLSPLEEAGFQHVHGGKVREMFGLDGELLMVATDRVSAFDVILPTPIPGKGKVLTRLSEFWMGRLEEIVPTHLISARMEEFPAALQPFRALLEGRSMLVRRCRPLPVECVVRGYLAGSGWKEYQARGSVCGVRLPGGLREAEELPQPIFTPATKAGSGHDENISFSEAVRLLGEDLAGRVRDLSLQLYRQAREYAGNRGILISDTKFEFGLREDRLLLIDEVLTPDSSRFWPAERYRPGSSPPSFDKQFIRDYLETLDWDKRPPGPELPEEIVRATRERYLQAHRVLTGRELEFS